MESNAISKDIHEIKQSLERIEKALGLAENAVSTENTHKISSIDVGLGTHDLPNGTRVCPNGPLTTHLVDTRSQWIRVYATITHPDIEDFIKIVRECATGCATGALIALIATEGVGVAAAITSFKECFYLCVETRINEDFAKKVKISIYTQSMSGDWSGH